MHTSCIGWSQTPKHYISLVQTIGQYELPGMKTRGGQSIVRARGHAVTRMGRGATRVDGADHGRRGGGGNRRKKISDLFREFSPNSPRRSWANWAKSCWRPASQQLLTIRSVRSVGRLPEVRKFLRSGTERGEGRGQIPSVTKCPRGTARAPLEPE